MFYCDVSQAEQACELESEHTNQSAKNKKTSTMCFDLADNTCWSDKINDREMRDVKSFYIKAKQFRERMCTRGLVEDNLLKECLTKSEQENSSVSL